MSDEINRINPTVVEGAEDIHGAETFDADYSPLNRPKFSWRDNMAKSRRTLTEKKVGDMMKMRRMGRGRFDAQGYDDKLDESMGMSKKESKMEQSMKDRRDESKGMEKGMGRRAYQRVGTMDAEGVGSVLGSLIPQPHFVGFEEIQMERMKNQNTKDAQGYDDKLDESMGMSNKESKMGQSMKDRRDESKGMEKGMGRRAYQRVGTMDAEGCENCGSALVMNAEGEHGCGCGTEMEAEETMLGSIGEGNDFGQMEAEGFGAERRYRYGNRYITRDSNGRFKKNVDVGRSLSADRRRKAKTVKGVGQGGRGDYNAESKFDELSNEIAEQYEKKGKSKEEAEKIGKATAYKVGVAKYGKRGMTNKAKAGMRKKKMDAEETMLGSIGEGNDFGQMEAEETMLGSIGEGNDFGQMEAEGDYVVVRRPHHMARVRKERAVYEPQYNKPNMHTDMNKKGKMYDEKYGGWVDMNFDDGDVVDLTQGVLAKGGIRVGGMTASAIVLTIAGMSGYYYARR